MSFFPEYADVVIIGAGPAGLACAKILSSSSLSVVVLEAKSCIGPKACAGGLTWSGLLQQVPEFLIEASFATQHIFSRLQEIAITEKNPIIATVNRRRLGAYMEEEARRQGACISAGCHVLSIGKDRILFRMRQNTEHHTLRYRYLVGADGSSSLVRRFLGLPVEHRGRAINYQIPGSYDKMEWHMLGNFFANGYGWIFPHRDTISLGAYIPGSRVSALQLKIQLQKWALSRGFHVEKASPQAGFINYDYRGWDFDPVFLIGDAAGLASALTGEGIYPAILSGQMVAQKILNKEHQSISATIFDEELRARFRTLQKKHHLFCRAVSLTEKNAFLSSCCMEIGLFLLRTRCLQFTTLEMS